MKGLVNLGNTCFMASILQALASCPSLLHHLKQNLAIFPHKGLARSAAELVIALESEVPTATSPISPSALLSDLRQTHAALATQQQDAEELFLILACALFAKDPRYGWSSSKIKIDCTNGASLATLADDAPGLAAIAELADQITVRNLHYSLAVPLPIEDPLLGAGTWCSTSRHTEDQVDQMQHGVSLATHRSSMYQNMSIMQQPSQDLMSHPLMGLMSSGMHCSHCKGHQECKLDTFCDLSLSIPAPKLGHGFVDLEECLHLWSHPEHVEGAKCDRCMLEDSLKILNERKVHLAPIMESLPASRKQELTQALDEEIELFESVRPSGDSKNVSLPDSIRGRCQKVVGEKVSGEIIKRLRLARAPQVLCLHLRRVLPTISGFRKDRTPVRFGATLDIAPFTESFRTIPNGTATPRAAHAKDGKYVLVAVVEHLGDAYGGHYVCYRRSV